MGTKAPPAPTRDLTEAEAVALLASQVQQGQQQVPYQDIRVVAEQVALDVVLDGYTRLLQSKVNAALRRQALELETRATQPKSTSTHRGGKVRQVSTTTVLTKLASGDTLPVEMLKSKAPMLRGTGVTPGMTWGQLTREHLERMYAVYEAQVSTGQASMAQVRNGLDALDRVPDARTLEEACAALR